MLKASAYFVFNHVARQGYDKIITHAQPKYARLWRIVLGFKNALIAISASTDAAVLFRIHESSPKGSAFANEEKKTAAEFR